jgi:hypothetical protein
MAKGVEFMPESAFKMNDPLFYQLKANTGTAARACSQCTRQAIG